MVNPEKFHVVTNTMTKQEETTTYDRLGILTDFHPRNPTGNYDLILGQQAHSMIAQDLVNIFHKQWLDDWCAPPTISCMHTVNLDDQTLAWTNPETIILPRYGRLKVRTNQRIIVCVFNPSRG